MKRMGKRGSGLDLLWIAVILFVFSLLVVIGYKISSEINTEIQSNSAVQQFDTDGKARAASSTLTSHYPGVIDNTFLFLVFGLAIASFILAAMVRIHPIFYVFFLILWAIIIFLSAIFSNIFQEIAAQQEFAAVVADLTFISSVMTALPWFVGILGTILAIVMYKTYQNNIIQL